MQIAGEFTRAFGGSLLRTVWTYLAIGSTFVTFLPLPQGWRRAIPFGVAVLFVVAAYRAAWLLHKQGEDEITALLREIERLRRRPYDEAHRKLVERKLRKLTATGTDILRFLLHHGRFESNALMGEFEGQPSFDAQLTVLSHECLLSRADEQNPGRASVSLFWYINPEFVEVLKDLLYP